MLELSLPTLSVEEYLACEQQGDVRHEYIGGYVYALAGGSSRHNRIAGNVYVHLWQFAQTAPRRVYREAAR